MAIEPAPSVTAARERLEGEPCAVNEPLPNTVAQEADLERTRRNHEAIARFNREQEIAKLGELLIDQLSPALVKAAKDAAVAIEAERDAERAHARSRQRLETAKNDERDRAVEVTQARARRREAYAALQTEIEAAARAAEQRIEAETTKETGTP